jgi:hypothetical protein
MENQLTTNRFSSDLWLRPRAMPLSLESSHYVVNDRCFPAVMTIRNLHGLLGRRMQGRCLGRLRGQERPSLPQEPARMRETDQVVAVR